ncbi:hypothetical protein PIB30_046845 [Stylosanthes scabra]|uniref:Uncharacterized protein n=1 Tax=Stylosanthes scabra TaxID=79078 RepID=A0ABU6XGW2_9FABA|nr:hypothetical protein [Stylosanthes scabra]
MSRKNVEKLGKELGDVVEIENPWRKKTLMRTFLRAKVKMDASLPMPTSCWMKVSRGQQECSYPKALSLKDNSSPRYEPELGVNRARAIDGFEFEEYPDNQALKDDPENEYSEESSEKTIYEKEAKKRESGNLREEEMGVEEDN